MFEENLTDEQKEAKAEALRRMIPMKRYELGMDKVFFERNNILRTNKDGGIYLPGFDVERTKDQKTEIKQCFPFYYQMFEKEIEIHKGNVEKAIQKWIGGDNYTAANGALIRRI